MTELEQLRQQRDAYRLALLGTALHIESMATDDNSMWREVFAQVTAQDASNPRKRILEFILYQGYPSGAWDEAGVEDRTIAQMCKDLRLDDITAEFEAEIEESCAQNRALHEADEDEQARYN